MVYLDGQYFDGDGHTIYITRGYTHPRHAIKMNMAKLGVRQWNMIGETSWAMQFDLKMSLAQAPS